MNTFLFSTIYNTRVNATQYQVEMEYKTIDEKLGGNK